jgi:ribonuclease HI
MYATTKIFGGGILQPFTRIGGRMLMPPPLFALAQVDASYRHRPKQVKVAYILTTADGSATYKHSTAITASSPTEAEWVAVATGLQAALEKGEFAVGIENDCLSVIHSLTNPDVKVRQEYARYYKAKIAGLAAQSAWTGVRWIPRERNDADLLMR